jgi:hypothetical protein
MRIVVAVLAILSLVAGLAGEVSAQADTKKRHKHAKAQVRQPAGEAATRNTTDGYVVRDANKLPFGSSVWWEQMQRENRAGSCCN